jgi:hypothetical protein
MAFLKRGTEDFMRGKLLREIFVLLVGAVLSISCEQNHFSTRQNLKS